MNDKFDSKNFTIHFACHPHNYLEEMMDVWKTLVVKTKREMLEDKLMEIAETANGFC